MKVFLDTEFIERPGTLELISLGMVDEKNRQFYAINAQANLDLASEWVVENVLKGMPQYNSTVNAWNGYDSFASPQMSRKNIARAVLGWMHDCGIAKPEFWGYYADYDWVVFCWLFGPMIKLPKGWPMYCRDVKQLADSMGNPKLPPDPEGEHNALADARWNKLAWEHLQTLASNSEG